MSPSIPRAHCLIGSPFVYIVSPGSPVWQNSIASGDGLHTAKAGTNSTFYLQLMDVYKNEVKSCPYLIQDHFLGMLEEPIPRPESRTHIRLGSLFGTSSAQVYFTCSGGKLVGQYRVPVAGDYQLLVTYENNIVPGFPTNVHATSK